METLLKQKRFLVQSTSVALKDSHNIVVEQRLGLSVTQQTFPLDRINPDPVKVQSIRFRWVIVSLVMIILTVAAFLGSFQPDGPNPVGLTTAVILGFLTAVSIAKAIGEYRNLLVFTEPQTNRSLFTVQAGVPNKRMVENFVETLGRHIRAVRYPEGITAQQRIEHYKKHIQFLLDEGVLTANEHAAILARLDKKAKSADVVKLVPGDI